MPAIARFPQPRKTSPPTLRSIRQPALPKYPILESEGQPAGAKRKRDSNDKDEVSKKVKPSVDVMSWGYSSGETETDLIIDVDMDMNMGMYISAATDDRSVGEEVDMRDEMLVGTEQVAETAIPQTFREAEDVQVRQPAPVRPSLRRAGCWFAVREEMNNT